MDVIGLREEGGVNGFVHKLPGRMTWPHIVLRRGVCDSDALFSWTAKTSGPAFEANSNLKLARSTGAITAIGSDGGRLRAWELQRVFAVRWTRGRASTPPPGSRSMRNWETRPPRLHLQNLLRSNT